MSKSIKEQNDHFRKTRYCGEKYLNCNICKNGRTMMTSGVSSLDGNLVSDIVKHVRNFEEYHVFTEDNDPYGEHDFGSFNLKGVKIFWKIDYFDKDFKYHSEDKSNPEITNRVLTIMKAEEY